MARGGYRAGAGRPKGSTVKAHSKKTESELTPEQKENIRLLLSFGKRIMDGGKLTRAEEKQLEGFQWGLTAAEERMLKEFKF